MKTYQIAVVIGRFQPFHKFHLQLVQHAFGLADRVLIVLGSARNAPDVKNPFVPALREKMIRGCFAAEDNERLEFYPIRDYPYNENNWIIELQNAVRNEQETMLAATVRVGELSEPLHNKLLGDIRVALVGYYKDASSYYLKNFPQWTFEEYFQADQRTLKILNATDIRELYFTGGSYQNLIVESTAEVMREFAETATFADLKREFEYLQEYKKNTRFVGANFDPVFVTTDAVVTAGGHVLVIRRGHQPGKGLLALPGGFLAPGYTLEDNVFKELKEETAIHVPAPILRSSVKARNVFDYPQRSLRGRTITHGFYLPLSIKLEDGLPLVKGGDDAAKAFWMPIADLGLTEDQFFEDHVQIIKYFLGI